MVKERAAINKVPRSENTLFISFFHHQLSRVFSLIYADIMGHFLLY